jgi:hypothetical protein
VFGLRFRHPRSDELSRLKRLFKARVRDPVGPGPEELRLAAQMRLLRSEILTALDPVQACRTCAEGYPPPNGRWPGGYCCGGVTEALFTEVEIVCLTLSGTRARHLRPKQGRQAGCLFRGPGGCSLSFEDRPNRCVSYLCNDLMRELARDDRLAQIEELCTALEQSLQRYGALYAVREAENLLKAG